MSWVATGAMTTVLLAALGFLSFWVAHSIDALGQSLRGETATLGQSLRGEMDALGQSLRGEMDALGQSLRGEIAGLRGDIGRLDTRLTTIESRVLADHGERIARLEERAGL